MAGRRKKITRDPEPRGPGRPQIQDRARARGDDSPRVTLRVPQVDLDRWKKAAARAKKTVSTWVLEIVNASLDAN